MCTTVQGQAQPTFGSRKPSRTPPPLTQSRRLSNLVVAQVDLYCQSQLLGQHGQVFRQASQPVALSTVDKTDKSRPPGTPRTQTRGSQADLQRRRQYSQSRSQSGVDGSTEEGENEASGSLCSEATHGVLLEPQEGAGQQVRGQELDPTRSADTAENQATLETQATESLEPARAGEGEGTTPTTSVETAPNHETLGTQETHDSLQSRVSNPEETDRNVQLGSFDPSPGVEPHHRPITQQDFDDAIAAGPEAKNAFILRMKEEWSRRGW